MPIDWSKQYDTLPSQYKWRERHQQMQDAMGMRDFENELDKIADYENQSSPVNPPISDLVKSKISREPLGKLEQTGADMGSFNPVKDAIKKKYGFGEGLDDKALVGAQDAASEDKFHANLGDATSQLGYAIAGVQRPKDEFYNNLRKQADQGVENLQARRKGVSEDLKLANEQRQADPENPSANIYRDSLKKMFGEDFENVDLSQLTQNDMDSLTKLVQIKEQTEARKEQAKMNAAYRDALLGDKREKAAKLSDSQVKEVSDFDQAMFSMEDAIAQSSGAFLGPLDGRKPDFLASGKEAAFRSAVGKINDAYRKLITGAGANNAELRRLESRLPNIKDTPEQFRAKANEFMKTVQRNKQVFLGNLGKLGKNVKDFQGGNVMQDSQAVEWAKQNPNDPRAQKILKLNGM